MIKILLVGMGGFAGSVCRYMIGELSARLINAPIFPYGTLAANLLGCLVIGLLGGAAENRQWLTPEIRALVMVGFLGGFTTFSTFGYDIFNLTRNGQAALAAASLILHMILGIGAVWLGFSMSKMV